MLATSHSLLERLRDHTDEQAWQRLLSIPQAAEYLGVCAKTMWRLVWESEIPQIRIARRVLVDIRDLDRYIESQKN